MWVIADNAQLTLKFSHAKHEVIFKKVLSLLFASTRESAVSSRERGRKESTALKRPWKFSPIL